MQTCLILDKLEQLEFDMFIDHVAWSYKERLRQYTYKFVSAIIYNDSYYFTFIKRILVSEKSLIIWKNESWK